MSIKKLLPFSFNKKYVQYVLFFIGFYFLFLLMNLPAKVIFSAITLPDNIKISSVSGTVWSGEIQSIRVSNVKLGTAKWTLSPLNLFLAELSSDISIIKGNQFIKSKINLSPSGKVELSKTKFFINLSSLQPLIYGMPFSYSGTVSGSFPSISFYQNNYIGINGDLSLAAIKLTSPQQQLFGDFIVKFKQDKDGTIATGATGKDSAGPLGLDAKLKLSKEGQLNVSAKLSADKSARSLTQMISILGKRNANREIEVNTNIKLW